MIILQEPSMLEELPLWRCTPNNHSTLLGALVLLSLTSQMILTGLMQPGLSFGCLINQFLYHSITLIPGRHFPSMDLVSVLVIQHLLVSGVLVQMEIISM